MGENGKTGSKELERVVRVKGRERKSDVCTNMGETIILRKYKGGKNLWVFSQHFIWSIAQ